MIERQFNDALRSGLIEVRKGITIGSPGWIRTSGKSVGLAIEPDRFDDGRLFAAVILAVGFGHERKTGERFPGYWSNDCFSQAAGKVPRRYLIQGAGDGGLTDLLRLRLSLFDQDSLFQDLLPDEDPRVKNLKAAVQRIEKRAADALQGLTDGPAVQQVDADMDASYRALDVAWLDDRLESSGLRPNSVVLNDKYVAFGHRRFPLNKLLASRLVANGRRFDVEWVQRDLGDLEPPLVGPVEVDLGDGQPPRGFDRVLFRLGPEAAIRTFGDEIARGCREMIRRGGDVATTLTTPGRSRPPLANGARALAAAMQPGRRVVDLIQTLLLFLRHAGRPIDELGDEPGFERLRFLAYASLPVSPIVATDTAPEVAEAAAEFLRTCAPPDVAARALVEALELRWRAYLGRSFRGQAGRRHRTEYGPNSICPRGHAPHDASDVGVGTVALMPAGAASLQIEWMATSWPAKPRIATGRVFDSIDDLKMTVLSDGEELIEFFEAEAQDAAEHADRLDYLASQLSGRAVDLVVLPEFALHAAPSWASDVSTRLDAIVFAGRGHVRAGARKAHRSVVAFTDSTVLLGKTAPSTYVRGTRRWREDIHTEPPRLLMVGDGQMLVALATEDAFESADLVKILAALPPHAVVIAGASGAIASQQCEALHLAFFVVRFGAPLPHRSATLQAPVNKVIEIINLFDS